MRENPAVSPEHYKDGDNPVQLAHCIEFIVRGKTPEEAANLGPVIKYLGRYGKKPGQCPLQDIDKAIWYFFRLRALVEWGKNGGAYPDPAKEVVMVDKEYLRILEEAYDTQLVLDIPHDTSS